MPATVVTLADMPATVLTFDILEPTAVILLPELDDTDSRP